MIGLKHYKLNIISLDTKHVQSFNGRSTSPFTKKYCKKQKKKEIMLSSFILFCFIGLVPYVAAYFGLGIEYQSVMKVFGSFYLHYILFSVLKLFLVALILPEVEGFKAQTFIINMVISSLEFAAYHLSLKKKNDIQIKTITYLWSLNAAIIASVFPYISNSLTYELEIQHVIFALSSCTHIIQWFAARNLSSSIQKTVSIFRVDAKTQILILLFGLPQAFGSLGTIKGLPAYFADVARFACSVVLYFVTALLSQPKEKQQ